MIPASLSKVWAGAMDLVAGVVRVRGLSPITPIKNARKQDPQSLHTPPDGKQVSWNLRLFTDLGDV